jgi:SPP1 family predicted phage head-tail adaptor
MRHRVTVQQLSHSRDALGQESEDWTAVATRWAFVEPLRGAENYQRSGETTQIDYKVTLRHEEGLVTTERRLVYGALILDIESVINIHEKDHTIEVMCRGSNRT